MEGKETPIEKGDPLNRLPTMYGTIKQKMIYPDGTPMHGPPPPGGTREGKITTALRPITAARDTKNTPLCDLMLCLVSTPMGIGKGIDLYPPVPPRASPHGAAGWAAACGAAVTHARGCLESISDQSSGAGLYGCVQSV